LYVPVSLDLTVVSLGTLGRYFWSNVLDVVVVWLVLVLDSLNGVHEFMRVLANDLLDVHALFVIIFDDRGSESDDLWDALRDAYRCGAGRDRLNGL